MFKLLRKLTRLLFLAGLIAGLFAAARALIARVSGEPGDEHERAKRQL